MIKGLECPAGGYEALLWVMRAVEMERGGCSRLSSPQTCKYAFESLSKPASMHSNLCVSRLCVVKRLMQAELAIKMETILLSNGCVWLWGEEGGSASSLSPL